MPRPDWMPDDFNPLAESSTHMEIVGRGRKSRATKTNIPDVEAATILQRIGNVAPDLADLLRDLHAAHYTRTVSVKDPDTGVVTINEEPELLTYEELREKYDSIRMWEEGHQGQVDHLVSVKGFSVIRATGGQVDPPKAEKAQDSSAGSDSKTKTRWQ